MVSFVISGGLYTVSVEMGYRYKLANSATVVLHHRSRVPGSQNHASRRIGYATLPLGVNESANVCVHGAVQQTNFLSSAYSCESLQIHYDPDQMLLKKNVFLPGLIKCTLCTVSALNITFQRFFF